MKVILLGATGSIGMQTLDILRKNNEELVGFSFGDNVERASNIIKEFKPQLVCAKNEFDSNYLAVEFPGIRFVHGDDGLVELSRFHGGITVVNALVGSVGIRPTVEAIKSQRRICLANKETLVVAGDFIMPLVREYGVELLPIDSEHVALHQLLELHSNLKEVYLTASGGALRDWPLTDLNKATKEDVLQHPTWIMGAKITVDSATMMNKGFEVLEAMHLFGLEASQVKTILHRESIVHAMVKLQTGAIIQHIAPNDMKYSIEYSLYYPNKKYKYDTNPSLISKLHFEEMSFTRYPLLQLTYEVARKKGILPCVLNAANEAAVELFLKDKISFIEIGSIVLREVKNTKYRMPESIEDLLQLDRSIKDKILNQYP
jgi:1-deoxy-D-xylulose-5-phosphate reductoisomerase